MVAVMSECGNQRKQRCRNVRRLADHRRDEMLVTLSVTTNGPTKAEARRDNKRDIPDKNAHASNILPINSCVIGVSMD